jgi:hypothetical protein
VRFSVCSSLVQFGIVGLINVRPGGTLRWKVEDRRLGRSGSVIW